MSPQNRLLLTKFLPKRYNTSKMNIGLSAAVIVQTRQRIVNPVKIRNGAATVCAEELHGTKVIHWEKPEKVVWNTEKRKSGDLLRPMR